MGGQLFERIHDIDGAHDVFARFSGEGIHH
jgi:hypothetical protein